MIGPHDFVPTRDDEQSCDVCSGVPGIRKAKGTT